jgi:hypothetical protein
MDVKGALLNDDIHEEIYCNNHLVLLLKKILCMLTIRRNLYTV